MTNRIQYQKKLLKTSLDKLDEIELTKHLLQSVDPIICKIMVEELQRDYADIMALLKMELMSINETPTLSRYLDINFN